MPTSSVQTHTRLTIVTEMPRDDLTCIVANSCITPTMYLLSDPPPIQSQVLSHFTSLLAVDPNSVLHCKHTNSCEELCYSGNTFYTCNWLYDYAHSPFAVYNTCGHCTKELISITGLHLHQEVNTVWLLKKKERFS